MFEGKSLRWADEWLRDEFEEEFVEGGAEFGGLGGGNMAPKFEDAEELICWDCWDGGGVILGVFSLFVIGVWDVGANAVTCGFRLTYIQCLTFKTFAF